MNEVEVGAVDVTLWAGRCNFQNHRRLFRDINVAQMASGRSPEEVARRLGVDTDTLEDAASGERDLSLTELRLLANACDVIVEYRVTPASVAYERFNGLRSRLGKMVAHNPDDERGQSWEHDYALSEVGFG